MNHFRARKSAAFAAVGIFLTLGMIWAAGGCDQGGDKKGGSGSPTTGTTSASADADSSSGASPSQLKLAFVTNNASEFWKIAAAGVHKFEKESGVTVDIKMPPNGKVEEQNQILEELVAQGYNGIAVSVIAPSDQVAEVNRAAKKTHVICFDSDAPKSKRLAYIGTENFQAGKVLGQQIVKLLPSGGKIAVFVGTFAADNAKQRLDGVKAAIDGHNIEIIAQKEDQTDRNKARTNVEDVLNGFSDVNLMVGLWSYNGPAIAKAIEASGKKGKVLAAVFDQEEGTLDGIAAGTISCTLVQNPFQMGYLSPKLLADLSTKGMSALPSPPIIDTGVRVIDSSNVASYRAELAEMQK